MIRAKSNSRIRTPFGIAILAILLTLLNEVSQWPILKLWNIYANNGFIDFAVILNHIACFDRGVDIDVLRLSSGKCGGFWYGETWLKFGGLLNLHSINIYLLILPVILIFYWQVFLEARKAMNGLGLTANILIVAIVVSPPLILLVQRGNLDLLMFLFLMLSAKLINTQKEVYIFAAFLILTISTLIKFWTLPTLFVAILYLKNKWLQLISFASSLIIAAKVFSEYKEVDFGEGSQSNINVFGLHFLSLKINSTASYSLNVRESILLDWCFFIGTVVMIYFVMTKVNRKKQVNTFKIMTTSDPQFAIFGSSFVFVYLVSTNVDYRLVLLIFIALNTITFLRSNEWKNMILLFVSAALWLTYPSGQLQIVGDFITSIICVAILILFIYELVMRMQGFVNRKGFRYLSIK
jgi:hypothetical protein